MVAGLLGSELGDGGENTIRVAGEHDNVLRLAIDDAGDASVGDKLYGIRTPGVLSDADIVVIRVTRGRIIDNILEDGAEADSVVNLGLLFAREVNTLGVAATLDIEDTRVRPDVFIVTDELSARIRRKSTIARVRQEEFIE